MTFPSLFVLWLLEEDVNAAAALIHLSDNLVLYPSLTCEQDPKILELLHMRQRLSPNREGAIHLFPVILRRLPRLTHVGNALVYSTRRILRGKLTRTKVLLDAASAINIRSRGWARRR